MIIVFSLLGAVTGIFTGSSREPVVGAVMPGVLTFMTVVAGYAFTSESLAKLRAVVPFCLIALLLSSLYFAFVGSKIRFLNEAYAASAQQNLLRFEKVELEFEKAKKFKDAGLSLPAESSKSSSPVETVVPWLNLPKKH